MISAEGMDYNSKCSLCRISDNDIQNWDQIYISVRSILIITLEYAYRVALKCSVNNNEEAKQNVILIRKIKSLDVVYHFV